MQIDAAQSSPFLQSSRQPQTVRNAVFRLETRQDDRINGSIPVFGAPENSEEEIQASLSGAAKNSPSLPPSAKALAETTPENEESFNFFDLIDMINPLQHIPLVGSFYRKLTGDEIKPMSRIVGGAAFGGPLGAASGIVNAVAQWGTGKDVADNFMDSASPTSKSSNDTTIALANLAADNSRYNS